MTVVAGLSVRDPFLIPFDKKDLAESAKAQFSARDCSDHLALVRAYNGWKDAERQQSGHEILDWLISHQKIAIQGALIEHLMRAVICAGLFPGLCSVVEKSITLENNGGWSGASVLGKFHICRYNGLP
ncbi:hypothetical protein OIU77_008171 [Salix suchowensis]|uniref:Uncharacterized protein n=1 Tax=Salix suchowensis TaxID=1278906 RepID=A0ABQ9AIL4_9ROSI|nr:hypothetical protein OIU77_008171 [Salix suchowensis]